MPTSATSFVSHVGALAFTLGLTGACRGNLPPTEPRHLADESLPGSSGTSESSSTGQATLGPLAGLGPAAAGSGGTSVLPKPSPGPGGGGMGGAVSGNAP
jgi:hypothetical protein